MKWQRYLGPVIAIAAGVLGGVFVFARVRDLEPSVPVVVAAVDLVPGAVVGREQIRVVRLPALAAHPEAYRSAGQVEGREVGVFVRAGEQLLPSKFSGDAVGVARDRVLLYVPLPAPGYPGGFVSPGSRVTLLVVRDRQGGEPEVRVAAADVRVADVDRERREGRDLGRASGLTVEVEEAQVPDVAAALASGDVRVVRRSGATYRDREGAAP